MVIGWWGNNPGQVSNNLGLAIDPLPHSVFSFKNGDRGLGRWLAWEDAFFGSMRT